MASRNLHFEMSIKSTLNGFLLQMLRLSVVETTLCVYVAGHFDPQVNSFPNQVSLFQPKSPCFNPGQFGWVQNTGHRSLFHQYRKYPKHSLKLTLGLTLALANSEGCFCIGRTMTCDLCFVPAPN